MFTPGRYGGYVDCLASTQQGRMIAVEWKTWWADEGAVQLAAFASATHYLERTGSALLDDQAFPLGHIRRFEPAAFSRYWVVILGQDRWLAYDYDPTEQTPGPAIEAFTLIYNQTGAAGQQLDLELVQSKELPYQPLRLSAHRRHRLQLCRDRGLSGNWRHPLSHYFGGRHADEETFQRR